MISRMEIKVSLVYEGVVWSKANNVIVLMALCDRTVFGCCWITSSIKLRIVHLGYFSSPSTMKLIQMNLWHFEIEYLHWFIIQNFSNLNYHPCYPTKNMVINVILPEGKVCLSVWPLSVLRHLSLFCYTLNQSIEIAVLPSIYDPTHDENIKTTNTVRREIP